MFQMEDPATAGGGQTTLGVWKRSMGVYKP